MNTSSSFLKTIIFLVIYLVGFIAVAKPVQKNSLDKLNILVIGHDSNSIINGNANVIADDIRSAFKTSVSATVLALPSYNIIHSIYTEKNPTPISDNDFLTTIKDPKWNFIVYIPVPQLKNLHNLNTLIVSYDYQNTNINRKVNADSFNLQAYVPIVAFSNYSYIIESVLALKRYINPNKTKLILGAHNQQSDENNVPFIHRLAHNTSSLATSQDSSQAYINVISNYIQGKDIGLLPVEDTENYLHYLSFKEPGFFAGINVPYSATSTERRLHDHLNFIANDGKNLGDPCNIASGNQGKEYFINISRPIFNSQSPNIPNLTSPPLFANMTQRISFILIDPTIIPMLWQETKLESDIFSTMEASVRWFAWLQEHPSRYQAHQNVTSDDYTHVASCVSAIMASAFYTAHRNKKALLTPRSQKKLISQVKNFRKKGLMYVGGTGLFTECSYQDLVAAYEIGYEMAIEHQYAGDFATIKAKKLNVCGDSSQVLPPPPIGSLLP